VSCKHGAIRRPVTPLRLTRRGQALMHRWGALASYRTAPGTGHSRRANTVSAAIESAAALYDSATRRLDEVIKLIEDIPVNGLPADHLRTSARLLADAYDLWRGLVDPRRAEAEIVRITGTDTVMTSTTGHTTQAVDEQRPYGPWRVSRLPGRTVRR
jgi:hypothetical protein